MAVVIYSIGDLSTIALIDYITPRTRQNNGDDERPNNAVRDCIVRGDRPRAILLIFLAEPVDN